MKESLEMVSKESNEELWKAIIEWIRIQLKRKHSEENIEFFNADLSKYGRREVKSMLETMTEKLIDLGEQKGQQKGSKKVNKSYN